MSKKLKARRRNVLKVIEENRCENQRDMVHEVLLAVQNDEANERKYLKELRKIYDHRGHKSFMECFINAIKSAIVADEKNYYAKTLLLFCARFAGECNVDDNYPVLDSTFNWILSNVSINSHVRYRMCEFVNHLLNALGCDASLDDDTCDNILHYMVERLRDTNPNVRVQAIMALQRLQMPENPDNDVIKCYLFHLGSDPSPRVRQAVITVIGRNFNTIPYIIERLWDVDEKVRRHTYLHMSSYPVKAYKVDQRITFLEKGLSDRSEIVRKAVITVLLPQWFESYDKNIIKFISAFKLDANEMEMDRFRKIMKITLKEIFKKRTFEELSAGLPLQTEGEFKNCIIFSQLSVESTLYWLSLVEYYINDEELDLILPELSVFCFYLLKYCQTARLNSTDKWERLHNRYILLSLIEILYTYDLGDEVGRSNLQEFFELLLKNYELEERVIKIIVQCCENLITNQEERSQFFIDIIYNTIHIKTRFEESSRDRIFIENLLKNIQDDVLKLRYSNIRVKILDLEEQEASHMEKKQFPMLDKLTEEINQARQDYNDLLKNIYEKNATISLMQNNATIGTTETNTSTLNVTESALDSLNISTLMAEGKRFHEILSQNVTLSSLQVKKITPEVITKCLQIAFYMIASKHVATLTANVHDFYQDFIIRYCESSSTIVREWALKCSTACSMLRESLAEEVYNALRMQFILTINKRIWKTVTECIFELIDRYGFVKFNIEDKSHIKKTKGRQLFNTDTIDLEEETSSSGAPSSSSVDILFMFSHFLDTCEDSSIVAAIIKGFCRLILHSHYHSEEIVEKLLLIYFNPTTAGEISQILGVFFKNTIKYKKLNIFEPCLIPVVRTISSSPYDSPLSEIKVNSVLKFIIDLTRSENCANGVNIHDTFARTFLLEMQNNIADKELLRVLSKELVTLEITKDNEELNKELKNYCEKILERDIGPNARKSLQLFVDILDGKYKSNEINLDGSNEENDYENQTNQTQGQQSNINNNEIINQNRTVEDEQNILMQHNSEHLHTINEAVAEKSMMIDNQITEKENENNERESQINEQSSIIAPSTQETENNERENQINEQSSVIVPSTQETENNERESQINEQSSVIVPSTQETENNERESQINEQSSIIVPSTQETENNEHENQKNEQSSTIVPSTQETENDESESQINEQSSVIVPSTQETENNERESQINEQSSIIVPSTQETENTEQQVAVEIGKEQESIVESNSVNVSTVNLIITPTKTQDDEEIIKNKLSNTVIPVPTTYGKANTPSMRYLRKSLNLQHHRHNSVEDIDCGSRPPPKIRIEAKLESGKKDEKMMNTNLDQNSSAGTSTTLSSPLRSSEARSRRRRLDYSIKEPAEQRQVTNANTDEDKNQSKTSKQTEANNQQKQNENTLSATRKSKRNIQQVQKTPRNQREIKTKHGKNTNEISNITNNDDSVISLSEVPGTPKNEAGQSRYGLLTKSKIVENNKTVQLSKNHRQTPVQQLKIVPLTDSVQKRIIENNKRKTNVRTTMVLSKTQQKQQEQVTKQSKSIAMCSNTKNTRSNTNVVTKKQPTVSKLDKPNTVIDSKSKNTNKIDNRKNVSTENLSNLNNSIVQSPSKRKGATSTNGETSTPSETLRRSKRKAFKND